MNICSESILENSRRLTDQVEETLTFPVYLCNRNRNKTSLKELGREWAKRYYEDHKMENARWRTIGNDFKVKYESAERPGKRLSSNNELVNFYRSRMCRPGMYIDCLRFGIPVVNFKQHIKNMISKINSSRKRSIVVSLLSDCNHKLCSLFEKSPNKALYLAQFVEPKIVKEEKFQMCGNRLIAPIFLHLSGFPKIGAFPSRNNLTRLNEWCLEEFGIPILNQFENVNSTRPEILFKTIVDIAAVYFMLNFHGRHEYQLVIHCRSGKDRTSVVDAIVKATHEFMFYNEFNRLQNDYEQIRRRVSFWIVFGLVIANRYTGGFGLKLDYIPLARYVFDRETFDYLRGNMYKF